MRILGTSWTATSATAEFPAGTVAMDQITSKVYKYLQYNDGGSNLTAVVGNCCYYYFQDGYKSNLMTMDISNSNDLGAGVLVSVPADGEYCWVQISGHANVAWTVSPIADGAPLLVDSAQTADDGKLHAATAPLLLLSPVVASVGDASDDDIICMFPF